MALQEASTALGLVGVMSSYDARLQEMELPQSNAIGVLHPAQNKAMWAWMVVQQCYNKLPEVTQVSGVAVRVKSRLAQPSAALEPCVQPFSHLRSTWT